MDGSMYPCSMDRMTKGATHARTDEDERNPPGSTFMTIVTWHSSLRARSEERCWGGYRDAGYGVQGSHATCNGPGWHKVHAASSARHPLYAPSQSHSPDVPSIS